MNTVGKKRFTALYTSARRKAFTKKDIVASWSKARLFLFNPDRVLSGIHKPLLDATKTHELQSGLELYELPLRSPVTLVSAESFASLHKVVIQQDATSLNATSKEILQRHMHKLAKAAQMSFAKGSL